MGVSVGRITAGRDVFLSVVSSDQGPAPSKFAGRAQDFFDDYLTNEKAPRKIPFGGRKKELRGLDNWLHNREAAPRFLIAGPGGRGKSALLVHWINELTIKGLSGSSDTQWRVIFVPISARLGTNLADIFYGAIASTLADILGEHLDLPSMAPHAYYQDRCRHFLDLAIEQKIPVLLVVDGIDEAIGSRFSASWFPRNPGATLRLLVSARWEANDKNVSGWIRRLGWDRGVRVESYDLDPLDPDGIDDLLGESGGIDAEPSLRSELPSRLHYLTGGEPLLLRFYVEDLWGKSGSSQRLNISDLDAIKPGLAGYFENWLEEQQAIWRSEGKAQNEIDRLYVYLAILACAHAPLAPEYLAELARRVGRVDHGFRLADSLYPIRRFVIGKSDNEGMAGYVLTHPKLSEFFRNEYFDPQAIKETRIAFANWGLDTVHRLNRGDLSTSDTAIYLAKYLGQHLQDVNAPSGQTIALVEEGWLRAKEFFDQGPWGFYDDVLRTFHQLEDEKSSNRLWRLQQLRCHLFLSSLIVRESQASPELIVRCFERGILTLNQASKRLHRYDASTYAKGLASIAQYLPEADQSPIMEHALNIAETISDPDTRADTLTVLAARLPGKLTDRFLQILEGIAQIDLRARASVALAKRLSPTEGIHILEKVLEAIERLAPDSIERRQLSRPLNRIGQRNSSRLRTIHTNKSRYQALITIIPHLSESLSRRVLEEIEIFGSLFIPHIMTDAIPSLPANLIDLAIEIILHKEDSIYFSQHLDLLIERLPPRIRSSTLELLSDISDNDLRAQALQAFAPRLSEDQARRAFSIASSLEGECLLLALTTLASQLPDDLVGDIEGLLDTIPDESTESFELRAKLLTRLSERFQGTERQAHLNGALKAARRIESIHTRVQRYIDIAAQSTDRESVLEEALQQVELCRDESRQESIVALWPKLPTRLLGRALESLFDAAFSDPWGNQISEEAWAALGPRLTDGLLARAVELITTFRRIDEQLSAFDRLAVHLPRAVAAAIWQRAISLSREVVRSKEIDRSTRDSRLAQLASDLPKDFIKEAIAVARAIDDPASRIEAFMGLSRIAAERDREVCIDSAFQAVELFRNDEARAKALGRIAPQLTKDFMPRAEQAAAGIADRRLRGDTLLGLIPQLPYEEQRESMERALRASDAIGDSAPRAETLAAFSIYLTGTEKSELWLEILDMVQEIRNGWERFALLQEFVAKLPDALVRNALSVADAIEHPPARAAAIAVVAAALSGPERIDGIVRALQVGKSIVDPWSRIQFLEIVAPHLQDELVDRASELAETLEESSSITIGAMELLEHDSKEAMEAIRDGVDREGVIFLPMSPPQRFETFVLLSMGASRFAALSAIAGRALHLSGAERKKLIEAAIGASAAISENDRPMALAALASQLPDAERGEILDKALAMVETLLRPLPRTAGDPTAMQSTIEEEYSEQPAIHSEVDSEECQERLDFRRFPGTDQNQSFKFARMRTSLTTALISMAPHLTEEMTQRVLQIVPRFEEQDRAELLKALSPRLSEAVSGEAFKLAEKIEFPVRRAEVMATLLPKLKDSARLQAFDEVLRAASAAESSALHQATVIEGTDSAQLTESILEFIEGSNSQTVRAQLLLEIAPKLPKSLTRPAMRIMWTLRDSEMRAQVRNSLLSRYSDEERDRLTVEEALDASKEDLYGRGIMPTLISELPEHLIPRTLEMVQSSDCDSSSKATILMALSSRLPPEMLDQAVKFAKDLKNSREYTDILLTLATRLPDAERAKMVEEALRYAVDKPFFVSRLRHLIADCPDNLKPYILDFLPTFGRELRREQLLWCLMHLAPAISALEGSSGILEVKRAILDSSKCFS